MELSNYIKEFKFTNIDNKTVIYKLSKKRDDINDINDVPKHTFCSICAYLVKSVSDIKIINMLHKILHFGNTTNVYLITKKYGDVNLICYGDNFANSLEKQLIERLKTKTCLLKNTYDYIVNNYLDKNTSIEIFEMLSDIYNYFKGDNNTIKTYCCVILCNIVLKWNTVILQYG